MTLIDNYFAIVHKMTLINTKKFHNYIVFYYIVFNNKLKNNNVLLLLLLNNMF